MLITLEDEIVNLKRMAERFAQFNMPTNAKECKMIAAWLEELVMLRADCAHCLYMYGEKGVSK